MPYNILVFTPRKPDISHADFKQHFETIHMPMLQRYGGEHFPKHHKRHYLQFSESNQLTVLRGHKSVCNFDAISEISFDDEAAFHAFMAALKVEEASKTLREDEKKFCDSERLTVVVVGDVRETERAAHNPSLQ